MTFTTAGFVVFFVAVWILAALTQGRQRKVVLLVASYAFYAFWDWRFTGLLLLSTRLDFSLGWAAGQDGKTTRQKRQLVATSAAVNLGLLGLFKYFDFFAQSVQAAMARLGVDLDIATLDVVLPVGISFYTFQTLSYVVDVARGRLKPTSSVLDFALYVAFFPQLVAGPIMRAGQLLPQLVAPRARLPWRGREAIALIGLGLFKKVCVADRLALVIDPVYAAPAAYDAAAVWVATSLYPVQIYCDFSGYTDIALGLALLLGVELAVNFRAPYAAGSLSDYWRRWHITLSTWLRDYLYIPLGGSRRGLARQALALLVTLTLGGLWHGASWTYVLWGLAHGLWLVAERLGSVWRARRGLPPADERPALWRRGATAFGVMMLFILFRSPDFDTFGAVLSGLFGATGGTSALSGLWCVVPIALFVLHQLEGPVANVMKRFAALKPPVFAALGGLLLGGMLLIMPIGVRPFVYFQF